VSVIVNRHDPAGEWRRLVKNTRINPLGRYSLGVLNWTCYNVLPPRIFGYDYYDLCTNTLHINSDSVPAAMHSAAIAKRVRGRTFPVARAARDSLPPFSCLF
jgi:hypothetical protein